MNDRPDYDVGDLVVCVTTDLIDCGPVRHLGKFTTKGRVVRVQKIRRGRFDNGAPLPCTCKVVVADGVEVGLVQRFRKVDPLPDSLTSLLASEPTREKVQLTAR